MTFAAKIEALMREHGLTQMSLGEAVGVSQRAVGGWLSGAVPHKRKARDLADYFGLSVEVLLDDTLALPPHRKQRPTAVAEAQTAYSPHEIGKMSEGDLVAMIQKLPQGARDKIISGVWDMIADYAFKYAHDSVDFELATADWIVEAVRRPDDIKMSDSLLARAKSLRERYEKAQIAARKLKEADLTDLQIESVDEIKHRVLDEFRKQIEK